jgi:hypothetical protein
MLGCIPILLSLYHDRNVALTNIIFIFPGSQIRRRGHACGFLFILLSMVVRKCQSYPYIHYCTGDQHSRCIMPLNPNFCIQYSIKTCLTDTNFKRKQRGFRLSITLNFLCQCVTVWSRYTYSIADVVLDIKNNLQAQNLKKYKIYISVCLLMLSYGSRVLVKSADGYTGPGTNNSKAMVKTFLIKNINIVISIRNEKMRLSSSISSSISSLTTVLCSTALKPITLSVAQIPSVCKLPFAAVVV